MEITLLPLILLGAAVFLLVVFFYYVPLLLRILAKVSGINISLIQLFLMRIRKVLPYIITRATIEVYKAGTKTFTRGELETHHLVSGYVEKVVHALVSALEANIDPPFQMVIATNLTGRDVLKAVQTSVSSKVIDAPPITAVVKDRVQLITKARATVRASIKQLVGGAEEETILTRVGEDIVSSIGSPENHKTVLENPNSISRLILHKGLGAGTAFEILFVGIIDIDIGKNIGTFLQMDQAQADKDIAQTKAKERRAMAVTLEQEMKAKTQEAHAEVIEAETEVPKAMVDTFRIRNLDTMDYYKMRNTEANISMRGTMAKPTGAPPKPLKD